MSTKEDIFENYTPPSYINRDSNVEVNESQGDIENPAWFNTNEGMNNTYTSENLNNLNMQQRLQTKLRLEALRRFLDETVSAVDLSTLTIPMDDKGEQ